MLVSEKAAILLQCFCSFLSGESKLRLRSVGCRTFRWIQKLQDPHGAGSRHRRHVADEFELPGEKTLANTTWRYGPMTTNRWTHSQRKSLYKFVWRKWKGFNGCCCYGSVSCKHTSACAKPGPNQRGKQSCLLMQVNSSQYCSRLWEHLCVFTLDISGAFMIPVFVEI